jgi:hypothetical protein
MPRWLDEARAAWKRTRTRMAERVTGAPPPDHARVAVGILTYNRPHYFEQVVDAAIAHFSSVADLYVYNDGSSPNHEYQRIFARLPASVKVIDAPENLGVGRAKNALLRAMMDHDYLFLLEDDVIPLSPRGVTGYLEASRRSGLEHLSFAHHGPENARGPLGVDGWVELYPAPVGAWCMYTRRSLESVGLMDEQFRNVWEHVEHTHRLAKAGFTTPYGRFADARGSASWFKEIPGALETSTIRTSAGWNQRILDGLEYWARKDPEHFPLGSMLDQLRVEHERARPPIARAPVEALGEFRIAAMVTGGDGFLDQAIASVRAQTLPAAGLVVGTNPAALPEDCAYVALLDARDRWQPTHLQDLASALQARPEASWAYGNFDEIDESGKQVRAAALDHVTIKRPSGTLALPSNVDALGSSSLIRRAALPASGHPIWQLLRSGAIAVRMPGATVEHRCRPQTRERDRAYLRELVSWFSREQVKAEIAPRLLACAWDRYKQAAAAGDWIACERAAGEAARYYPLVGSALSARLGPLVMKRPRAYAALRRLTGGRG